MDQEADLSRRAVEGLRKLNLDRDQILARLWELATLSHEATRGIIAGQIKALSMILAIQGLIPDRRFSPPATQTAAPPVDPDTYTPEWPRKQQDACEEPGDPVAATKIQPAAPQPAPARRGVPHPEPTAEPAPKSANGSSFPDLDRNQTSPPIPLSSPKP